MRYLTWTLISITVATVLFLATQYLASERIEVITLTTLDEAGDSHETRLWVVDHGSYQYLRAGADSGWYQRLMANPIVWVQRQDRQSAYEAVPDQDKTAVVNQLMNEKYTWGDDFFALLMDQTTLIPVELRPAM